MPSSKSMPVVDSEFLRVQMEKFALVSPRYAALAVEIERLLREAAKRLAPMAVVQSRVKTVSSFAEKAQRRDKHCPDPVRQFTDLCGARAIVHTRAEVNSICAFIREHFVVDEENSQDVCERLKPTEFGYRSVHYVVQLKPRVFPGLNAETHKNVFPDAACPMKAEVQVRTFLEHAWADFSHDRSYKGGFKLPVRWQRELANVAAVLEEADNSFGRIDTGLRAYAADYGSYMTRDEMREKLDLQSLILRQDPKNLAAAVRLAQLAVCLETWDEAANALASFAADGSQIALRELGWVTCLKHWKHPDSGEYEEGQKYLAKAVALVADDTVALTRIGDTWKNREYRESAGSANASRARKDAEVYYQRALALDSTEPHALGKYLSCLVANHRDSTPVSLMGCAIDAAVERCRTQADVRMNLPKPYYDIGKLLLLQGKSYDSLFAYAKGLMETKHGRPVADLLLELERELGVVGDKLKAYEWVRRLLMVARVARFGDKDALVKVMSLASKTPIPGPVVIVCGGCDPDLTEEMTRYRNLLLEGFRCFKGTVIAGGTTAGVSGLVGDLQEAYPATLRTIGYLPRTGLLANAIPDSRYSELRETDGAGFTALEPLQNWLDIVASGLRPSDVRVVGINGGVISGAEYRIALALGARVGVIEGSGREASKLLPDEDWGLSPALAVLLNDVETLRAFVGFEATGLTQAECEKAAAQVHDVYRQEKYASGECDDRTMAKWDRLDDDLRASNLEQIDHMLEKLRRIGCGIVRPSGREPALMSFTDQEVEVMAEMEHARWMVEKLLNGWKYGKTKNAKKKTTPYLVPWSELADDVRKWDRVTVKRIPEYLALVGLEVKR